MKLTQTGQLAMSLWSDSFGTDFAGVVKPQAEKANKSMQDFEQFMSKRAKLEKEFGLALRKLCDSYPPPVERGHLVGDVWEQLMSFTRAQATAHVKSAANCATTASELLINEEGYKTTTKSLVDRGIQLSRDYEDAVDAVDKTRTKYCRAQYALDQAQAQHRQGDPAVTQEKLDQCKDELADAEAKYKNSVYQTNNVQTYFFGSDGIQKSCNEFQSLETMRIQKVKNSVQRFFQSFAEGAPHLEALASTAVAKVKALDTREEIKRFAKANEIKGPAVAEFEFEPYNAAEDGDVGKPSKFQALKQRGRAALARGAAAGSGGKDGAQSSARESSKSQPGLLGIPLAELLMRDQAVPLSRTSSSRSNVHQQQQQTGWQSAIPRSPRNSSDGLPLILTEMCSRVIELGGEHTEGIFRHAVSHSLLQRLHEQLEQGDYSMPAGSDPHAPACVLKAWLRALPDPLVADYEQAIRVCSEGDAVQLFRTGMSGPLEQRVARYTLQFLHRLTKHEEKTKMNVENLAVVFGPSFLRAPTPAAMVQNIEQEKACIVQLIKAAPSLPEPDPLTSPRPNSDSLPSSPRKKAAADDKPPLPDKGSLSSRFFKLGSNKK